jgi:hypothetical protein
MLIPYTTPSSMGCGAGDPTQIKPPRTASKQDQALLQQTQTVPTRRNPILLANGRGFVLPAAIAILLRQFVTTT